MGEYADDDIDAGIDEMFGASAGDWLRARRRRERPEPRPLSEEERKLRSEMLDPDGPEDGRFWR